MYQVEKVHKQKSIELKKELLNFVFFLLFEWGGRELSAKVKKVFQRDKQWTRTWYLYYLNEIVSEKFKGIAIDEVCSNAYCFVWDHWEAGWLTDCLPSWLASWSSLSHRLSQPGCHCFGWYVPHPPPRWDFFTNWKLCVIFLFWIWYYVYLSIYSFPNWSGVIFCVITYTLIV